MVVEGDGIELAARLAAALGGQVRAHPAFLTAVMVDPQGDDIDVATARSERYRAPAALPEVRAAALREDLFRRDFTVNTMAIRLGPEPGAELIDLFDGRRDLEEKSLHVLHGRSFIDDPTRILRGVRLEQRLGFRLSPDTLELVEGALAEGVFDLLSGSRLREELILLLDDPALALGGIERLAELGVLRAIDPTSGAGRGGARAAARGAGRPRLVSPRGDRRSARRGLAPAPPGARGRSRAGGPGAPRRPPPARRRGSPPADRAAGTAGRRPRRARGSSRRRTRRPRRWSRWPARSSSC